MKIQQSLQKPSQQHKGTSNIPSKGNGSLFLRSVEHKEAICMAFLLKKRQLVLGLQNRLPFPFSI